MDPNPVSSNLGSSYNIATININAISNATKLEVLKTFIRTMDLDIIFLQEVCISDLSIPGYNVICNVDVTGARNFSLSLQNAVSNMGMCDSWSSKSRSIVIFYMRCDGTNGSTHLLLGLLTTGFHAPLRTRRRSES